jgi:cytochrome c oxidase assembly protein Cox11
MAALAVIVGLLGLSYAAVPLYSMFCQATGYGLSSPPTCCGAFSLNSLLAVFDSVELKSLLISLSLSNSLELSLTHSLSPLLTGSLALTRTHSAGTTNRGNNVKDLEKLRAEDPRLLNTKIKVSFHTNVATQIPWEFHPCQDSVTVLPGEKVLVFFNATNYSKEPVIGWLLFSFFLSLLCLSRARHQSGVSLLSLSLLNSLS